MRFGGGYSGFGEVGELGGGKEEGFYMSVYSFFVFVL